jgi:carboxyl-terminal processing protease
MSEVEQARKGKQMPVNVRATVIGVLLVAAAFWAGIHVGFVRSQEAAVFAIFADTQSSPPTEVDFLPFWRAWNILESRFVAATTTDAVTDEELLWGAIEGLADAYGDPYTVFLPPAENTSFEEDIRGSFGGVGIEIGIRNDILTVISPLKGSPAEQAGIEAGDRIVEIDGKSTEGITTDGAVQTIRGEVGTAVTLTVVREGAEAPIDIQIVRATIDIPTIDTEFREDGIFVISLYNFSAVSPNLFREALREFLESGSDKLILDLRNNPGGFLEASIDMASWFLPAGKVVVTEDFGSALEPRVHRSKGYDVFETLPHIVILVNEGSASASEILAGALQAHGAAMLVGEDTFGKGSVQELIPVTSDTSLKITIAQWLTPDGRSISDGGLTPDLMVVASEEDREAGIDRQLETAAEVLLVADEIGPLREEE